MSYFAQFSDHCFFFSFKNLSFYSLCTTDGLPLTGNNTWNSLEYVTIHRFHYFSLLNHPSKGLDYFLVFFFHVCFTFELPLVNCLTKWFVVFTIGRVLINHNNYLTSLLRKEAIHLGSQPVLCDLDWTRLVDNPFWLQNCHILRTVKNLLEYVQSTLYCCYYCIRKLCEEKSSLCNVFWREKQINEEYFHGLP